MRKMFHGFLNSWLSANNVTKERERDRENVWHRWKYNMRENLNWVLYYLSKTINYIKRYLFKTIIYIKNYLLKTINYI